MQQEDSYYLLPTNFAKLEFPFVKYNNKDKPVNGQHVI